MAHSMLYGIYSISEQHDCSILFYNLKGDIMKIAISSIGTDLDAQIDPRFGRCAHFIIVNADDMSFEVFDNESIALGGGAGIDSVQFVASKGAKVIISGNVGPNALSTLSEAGIQLFTGQTGTVRKAVEDFKMGKLIGSNEADASGKSGMMTRGVGTGRVMGRGMGRGRGIGRGMGRGGGAVQGLGRGRR